MLSSRLSVVSVVGLLLAAVAGVSAQTTNWYWSYSLLPYYTWNSEWYVCASGTLTSSSATANFDGSFLATAITGTRTFYNSTGNFPNSITGLSVGDFADNRFWPSGSSNPAFDASGFSYNVAGTVQSIYGPFATGPVNMFLESGQIVEADEAGGDVLGYVVISQSQSATLTCPTASNAPAVLTWSWLYTLTNSDSSYVCASGHLTTWVGYTNGSYQVEDVQGTRYLYTPTSGLSAAGIGGIAQPFSSGGNTNLVYPAKSGAAILDSGGLAYNLYSTALFGASQTAGSTTVLVKGGSSVAELGGVSSSSTTFTIQPWSATAMQCNSTSAIAALPSAYSSAVTTYNFVYTIQPYFNWDDEWSVCASGTMTIFSARNNSDGSNTLMGMTGTRRYSKNGVTTTQNIVELIVPGLWEGNDNKVWLNTAYNGGFSVDGDGISYNLDGTALFTNGGANGAAVNMYLATSAENGQTIYSEFDSNTAPQDVTGQFIIGTGSAVPACPAVNTNLTTYNYKYTVQQSTTFAVCVTGQIQASTSNLDGGLQILNINGNRVVYTAQGSASQGIGGVAYVAFNGYANNNELYPSATYPFSGDGLVYNMYEPVQVAGNFSAAYSVGITFISGQFYEYEPIAGQSASTGQKGTFAFSQTATYTCTSTPSDYGVSANTPLTGNGTAYFSYTIAPYYTWDSEWSVCASGTITYNLQQNADYSYTANNVQGIRRFANNSGTYTQNIVGASPYDGGDSFFWLSANAYLHPPVDLGGFSYAISGLGGLALGPNQTSGTANGNNGQAAINFYMINSAWPGTPNWFSTPSLVLSEDALPTGDVISSAIFTLNAQDPNLVNCATLAVPKTQLWQFYYTQVSASNEYYVCGSGQLTTWVANNNGGYLMIDVEGFRNFYVSSDAVFGSQFVFSTGLDGVYGPLEWATNDNYVYPSKSGTAGVLDSNGILMVAAPTAYFTPDTGANFVELLSNGAQVYEYLDAKTTPGTGVTGVMYVWPYGTTNTANPSAVSCNTTTPPSPFPANLYYAFRYTVTPYYTWEGYWSVCASGIMTVSGWSAQDYSGPVPSGSAYAVLGITGSRQYINNGQSTTQQITGLLQPFDDGYTKSYQGQTLSNSNMIYPGANGLDLNGVSYLLDGLPLYATGYTGDSNIVNVYNNAYQTGSQLTAVFEQGTELGSSLNTQSSISFAPVASATATAPSAQQCSSLAAPQQRAYAFLYTINSTTANSNWQVCASGQLWTNYVAADGGQVVMEIRGNRYFNYPASTYYSQFVQAFSGMSAPQTYGGNDNLVYPNRPSQLLSTNGVLANTNYQATQFLAGPSPYMFVNFASYSGNNQVYEMGGPATNILSNFQLTPVSTTGQNPTCKASYTATPTQTLYFSYQLTFAGGYVCASGAITALSTANADGSFTAVWISGFRAYSYNGAYTNATITGLAPQAGGSGTNALTGDNKVFVSTSGIVSATGLFYQTDNLIYYAQNTSTLQGSGWVNLQYVGGALTESGCAGCNAYSYGITAASGVVSASASAVTQCGSTSVTVGAGMESLSPTTGGNSGSIPSSSTGGASGQTSTGGAGGSSNAGGGGGISKGGIAGAVVGSVVGACILFSLVAFLLSRSRNGKSGKASDERASVNTNSNLGASRFTGLEESRGNGNEMEMSHVEQNGEGVTSP